MGWLVFRAGRGNGIGSSKRRFQPLATSFDRLLQLLHGELDGLRRKVAPGLELGQELLLGVLLEIFPY
jgi:hypothetical protein